MATRYPGALDRDPNELPDNIADSDTLDSPNHATAHNNVNGAVLQIEEKLGIGDTVASAGAVLHGTAAGESEWTSDPSIVGSLSVAKDSADAVINLTAHHDTEATAAELTLRKSDGSKASPALVDDNAVLGKIMFQGYDGNSYANGAQIRAQVDGTPADGDMPTEMIFMVTPDGGSETPATALTISPAKKATFAGAVEIDGATDLDGAVQIDNTVTVGVNDTGHDVIFYGATDGDKWKWDESSDAMLVEGKTFLEKKTQTGQTSFTCEPWANSTIMLGNYGSIGTQGSYRVALSWNFERDADSNFTHLDVNSYPQAGYIEIGNGGINFCWEADYENNHTDAPTKILQMNADALFPATTDVTDLGTSTYKYQIVYGNYFYAADGSNTYPGYVFDGDNNTGMYLDGSLNLGFSTNSVRKLVITPAGQFGIRDDAAAGTLSSRLVTMRTQTAGMTPLIAWAEYDVDAANGTAGIFMLGDSGDSSNPGTGDYFLLFRRGNGTTIGHIRGTGSASVTYNTSSDQTLKNDLGDAGDVGSIIDALKIHKFTWKDAHAEVGEQIGVFAQEVLDISEMPNGIAQPAETRNEVVDTTTDEDGNEVDVKEDVYYPASIDYSKLVPLLVQEIKSLRQRVATLEG